MSGIRPHDLRLYVIEPVLARLAPVFPGADSLAAAKLLLGTAAVESGMRYLHQLGGPALGIYEVEPATHNDVRSWLAGEDAVQRQAVDGLLSAAWTAETQLVGNLYYATAIARLVYWRRPEPLPAVGDLDGLAAYWCQHYNTCRSQGVGHGKGSVKKFIAAWQGLEYPL